MNDVKSLSIPGEKSAWRMLEIVRVVQGAAAYAH